MRLELTEEQELLRGTAREFAKGEVAPARDRVEKLGPGVEPWTICRDVFAKGAELGFTRLLLPESLGGVGRRCIDLAILLEEIGAEDISVAADLFGLTASVALVIVRGGDERQQRDWLGEICSRPVLLAGAQSEPNVAGSELFCPFPDPKLGMRTLAKPTADGYVLRGQKSAFVTNGGIAERYFILARTDLERPMHETLSVFYVPAEAAGFTTGKRTDLIGWKTSHHAELYFDDVKLDASRRIGPEGGGGRILGMVPEMPIGLAAAFVGLARAAYECALDYAKRRRSWGMPIAQHQTVAVKLADMYCDLQSARLMVWDAALACDTNPMEAAMLKAPAAKSHAVDVAIRNAQRCVEILGGYGVAAEYPAGRFLNDAWIGYSCDFTREVLRSGIAMALTMDPAGSPA